MSELSASARAARAWACYDCGKCTATCPISRIGGEYSPRRQVLAANAGDSAEVLGATVFRCLTCGLCDRRCPAGVAYVDLVRRLRELNFREGVEPQCPHGGALQSVMRMMAAGGTRQDRLGWLGPELATEAAKGEVFFWTGCTMYYDAFFPELGVATLDGTRAALKLLNHLGIRPVVSPEERCCGHDLLWNGDRASFERLARHNVALVEGSGASLLVVSCAECLRTWKLDYEGFFAGRPPRIVHLAELAAERVAELKLGSGVARRITYQDPCRLGRHLGIYEAPRRVLAAVPGVELAEMRKAGPNATCCAGGTWSDCGRDAKRLQVGRLREARATGAEVLVTACPKCQVHFRCAMRDPELEKEIGIEMRDVAELLAGALAEPG